jgi:hypothetical protein
MKTQKSKSLLTKLTNLLGGVALATMVLSLGAFGLVYLLFFTPILLLPTVDWIGRNYLDRVVANDASGIAAMAKNEENRGCVRGEAEREIATYGGASIRNVRVAVRPGEGSDDRIEWTIVSFDYRQPQTDLWQAGEITMMTNNRYNNSPIRSLNCIGG